VRAFVMTRSTLTVVGVPLHWSVLLKARCLTSVTIHPTRFIVLRGEQL
jgi:hypothetical protein